jgi:oxygen-dependent protoporphyrinogen oxidase
MEAKFGSLGRAVMKAPAAPSSGGTLFRTLKNGLGTLTDKLSEHVVAKHRTVECVERNGEGFRVRVEGEWIEAHHLILACPAWAAGELLASLDPALSALLARIPYTSSLTVALGYRSSDFDGQRAGHGFLVPQKERRRMAACTFVDTKFAHRAPEDRTLLRCFFGGAGDDSVLGESDESLVAMAREELRRILGLTAAPVFTSISRWPRSMAQYTVGHSARWAEIQGRVAAIRGLHLAGNGYMGIGIPDCIRMGRLAAAKVCSDSADAA